MRSKYKCGEDLLPIIDREKNGSNLWKGVCSSWRNFQENLGLNIGDGTKVEFWDDSSKSDDQLSWIGSGDCNNMKHDSSFSVVWRWRGPERIQRFDADTENLDRIFRRCPISRAIWYMLLPQTMHSEFLVQDFNLWMLSYLKNGESVNGRQWYHIFALAVDNIWQCRNKLIFEIYQVQPTVIVSQIWRQVDAISDSIQYTDSLHSISLSVKEINSSMKKVAVGGVFRDSNGQVIFAYALRGGSYCEGICWEKEIK
ncbi:hypothetical protein HKD37_15G043740 [Glycine soja]